MKHFDLNFKIEATESETGRKEEKKRSQASLESWKRTKALLRVKNGRRWRNEADKRRNNAAPRKPKQRNNAAPQSNKKRNKSLPRQLSS